MELRDARDVDIEQQVAYWVGRLDEVVAQLNIQIDRIPELLAKEVRDASPDRGPDGGRGTAE